MPQLPVFKAFCPPLPLGEGGYLVLHEHIKLMKIDIGEQWGNDPALRSAAICRVPFPPLHISSLEHHLHQCDYPFVIYLPFQNRQHFLMVDIVKEAFDVELDNPFHTRPVSLNSCQGGMAAFPRTESVRIFGENRLVDLFQQNSDNLLHQLVVTGGYSERTHLTVLFGNISAPHWREAVFLGIERSYQVIHPFLGEAVQGVLGHTSGYGSLVGV